MKIYNHNGRRHGQQMGSLFTDLRDKVETSLTNLISGSLTPSATATPVPVKPPVPTIGGVSITTIGTVAMLGLVVFKFLSKRR